MLFRKQITSLVLVTGLATSFSTGPCLEAEASTNSTSCSSRAVSPSVSTDTTFGSLANGVKGYFFDIVLVGIKKQCVGSMKISAQTADGSVVSFKATEKPKFKTLPDHKLQLTVTVRLSGAPKLTDLQRAINICKPKQMRSFSLRYVYGGQLQASKIDMQSLAICTA